MLLVVARHDCVYILSLTRAALSATIASSCFAAGPPVTPTCAVLCVHRCATASHTPSHIITIYFS